MKNLKILFRTSALSLAFLMLSCSQDENATVNVSKNTETIRLNRAAVQVEPHGKLEIINDTDFEMYRPLICFASDGGANIDTNTSLVQYITIAPRTTVILTDFESAYQHGLSATDEWVMRDHTTSTAIIIGTINGTGANDAYGLFQNYTDSSNGFFSIWTFFGKDGYMKGFVVDPDLANQIPQPSVITSLVKYANGFILY